MSGKVMGWIWDAGISDKTEKYVLLAYADHADHDGGGIFPSMALIAWKTGVSERHLIRVKQKLILKGYMVELGISKYQTPIYKIIKGALPKRDEWRRKEPGRKANTPDTSVTPDTVSGVTNEVIPLTTVVNTPDTSVTQTVMEPSRETDTRQILNKLGDAIAEVCGVNINITSHPVTERLKKVTFELNKEGITPADLEGFSSWWWGSSPPTINQFADNWGRYQQTVAATSGKQSEYTEAEIEGYKLLEAQEQKQNGSN